MSDPREAFCKYCNSDPDNCSGVCILKNPNKRFLKACALRLLADEAAVDIDIVKQALASTLEQIGFFTMESLLREFVEDGECYCDSEIKHANPCAWCRAKVVVG